MAVIKLHGYPHSIASMRALACLYEKELDFEFVNVDMQTGEHKKEPYLSLNPFGKLPAFEDGDLKLFESRAITQYIAQTYPNKGTKLTGPAPGIPIAQVLVWKSVEAHQFDPPTLALIWELVFNPLLGKNTDAAVVEENEAKLAMVLDVYEARLAQSKYLACDSFTLADLHHLPNINLLWKTQVKKLFDARPRVSAWVANITSRPAWAKVLALAQ